MNALVADIRRASLHDGPGLRTAVFFKGCPLRCAWCHNPECISPQVQTLFYAEKCIRCGRCASGCFSGARMLCGQEMTEENVFREILRDRDYYGAEGGVTFSGGEPLLQADFVIAVADRCRAAGIGCALETSLYTWREDVFSRMDVIMADLKIWDSALHQHYTGVRNEAVIENFRRLAQLRIPVIARTPVIPEIEQGIGEISAFLRNLPHVRQYELLPYHPLGLEKARALGEEQRQFTTPTKEKMKELNQYVFIR